jgi:hypothetical protein
MFCDYTLVLLLLEVEGAKMIEVQDYIDVKRRAQDLNCNIPNLIAILPRNFENAKTKEELVHEDSTATIRVLWKKEGIVETPIEEEGESIPFIVEKAFEWIGPLLLFTSTLITQNPQLTDISLGVVSNYLTDWFKGVRTSEKITKLDVVVEKRNGSYKKIHYEGSPEGLKELPQIIRSIHDEQ